MSWMPSIPCCSPRTTNKDGMEVRDASIFDTPPEEREEPQREGGEAQECRGGVRERPEEREERQREGQKEEAQEPTGVVPEQPKEPPVADKPEPRAGPGERPAAEGLRRRLQRRSEPPGGPISDQKADGLDEAGAQRAMAVIKAFRRKNQAASAEESGPGENKDGQGENKGKEIWKRVSMNLTRVNDAAALTRQVSDRELEFDDAQMTRISLRLDGMESYSVLGALISGFSLQLISSITMDDFGHPFSYFFAVLFVLFGTLTTLSALYATIIFALCSLHGKAGIGMNKDAGYLKYITSTAAYRESAFIALMSCFVGVLATLLCMLFMRTPMFPACLAVAASAYFCVVAARHVKDIMKLASDHIFR